MKKTVVILLMIVYGYAIMGAIVYQHYCMSKLAGWSFWPAGKEECGRCGMKEDKTGCCKDKHEHFKLNTDHQKAPVESLTTFILAQAIINPIPDFNFQIVVKVTESLPLHAPPDIGDTSLHVLHCVFLI